ncbi:hypothetical protein V6N13_092717 [Hibiscus sabdariffa]
MPKLDWKQLSSGAEENTLRYFALVKVEGQEFISSAPNFSALQKIVDMLWERNSLVRVSQAGLNLYVFSFANITVRDWVLENGPWHIQHKLLILRKWEPNLKKLDFDLERMPIWVQFFNVPLELYSKLGLSYIASVIGLPLYMDSVTASKERLEFAKVCIETGLDTQIPDQVKVVLRDKFIAIVKIIVPWLPPSFQTCKTFGNSAKTCLVGEPKGLQVWRKKEVKGVTLVSECGETSAVGEFGHEVFPSDALLATNLVDLDYLGVMVAEPGVVVRDAGVSGKVGRLNDVGDGIVVRTGNVVVPREIGKGGVVSGEVGEGVEESVGAGDNAVGELKQKKKELVDKFKKPGEVIDGSVGGISLPVCL